VRISFSFENDRSGAALATGRTTAKEEEEDQGRVAYDSSVTVARGGGVAGRKRDPVGRMGRDDIVASEILQ